jgi:hypothetical protein
VETDTTREVVEGDGRLERIVTRSIVLGTEQERAAHALFIFIGADAETAWLPEELERDQHGYMRVVTSRTGALPESDSGKAVDVNHSLCKSVVSEVVRQPGARGQVRESRRT